MSFGDAALFAAIMTLIEELEEQEQKSRKEIYYTKNYEIDIPEYTPDAKRFIERLCYIVKELFDSADLACNTSTDMSPNDIVPAMVCGVIFESINLINATDDKKRSIYRTASEFCGVEDVFPEELLFRAGETEVPDALKMLTTVGFNMLLNASEKGDNIDAGIGFVKVISEHMLYLEKVLLKKYTDIVLPKRPALVAVEKMISIVKASMQHMEKENPELKDYKEEINSDETITPIADLLNKARKERKSRNVRKAEEYYRQVREIQSDNWEAYFYTTFCSVYHTSENTNPSAIQNYTEKIAKCSSRAMRLAKNQLYSRSDIVDSIGEVAVSVAELASNYFVSSLNRYKMLGLSKLSYNAKNVQVNAIIQMLFAVGDSIEANFRDDTELCAYTACSCWKTAIECYENCGDIPVPRGLTEHYYKIRIYIPEFQCSKPIASGEEEPEYKVQYIPMESRPSEPTINVQSESNLSQDKTIKSKGCYVATAVYGSYDCPPVWTLRRFRDYFLAKSWFGRLFILFYYAVSPELVKVFGNREWFNKVCKSILDKLVVCLTEKGYENTEYSDDK